VLVGTALGVVVGFLSVMDCKRDALGAQLSELQDSVCELSADMKRLVGKPVLEALDEQLNERLAESQQLRSEVYIRLELDQGLQRLHMPVESRHVQRPHATSIRCLDVRLQLH
jgi:hypothetical protein